MAVEDVSIEDRLHAYVEYVAEGGDPYAPDHPLTKGDQEVWVSWQIEPDGTTRLDIRVDDERYGQFVNGRQVASSWEGGVDGPDVGEWEAVRLL